MEGSVKNLIEAENAAEKIVKDALKKEKTMYSKGAQAARDIISVKEQQLDQEYADEQVKVSHPPLSE
jgi:vacuolar-type H+-ATPase subunit H